MRAYLLLLLLSAVPERLHAATIPSHLKEEGHKIAKRFADEHEFEGHDLAYVLHEKHPDTFHHINRRDLTSAINPDTHHSPYSSIRLDLQTYAGESLRLRLKKRSIVDASTQFVSLTRQGRVTRSLPGDCFATGHEERGGTGELAAVSVCDGLHGVVTANGWEYYIHPVENDDLGHDDSHQVHVLWKRSTPDYTDDTIVDDLNNGGAGGMMQSRQLNPNPIQNNDAWQTSSDLMIEFAVFTDAVAWERLQKIAPGREHEYTLVSMAATNALYGDKEKVGYNVAFKVKLIEFWEVDPEEYDFQQDLSNNLGSFCKYTTEKYSDPKYDMHFLQTGVTQQDGPAAGMAFVAGVCKGSRCGNARSLAPNRHILIAHEIGHNLGFAHHEASTCPNDIKKLSGGFMGGGDGLDFSPCNKWELQELFSSGKGSCLFEDMFKLRPPVLPGQSRSPDRQCELYAGPGYKYFRPYEVTDSGACQMFLCINANESSPSYQSIIDRNAPEGFPCDKEHFCLGSACQPWTGSVSVGWNVDYLRSLKQNPPEWSDWPGRWGTCSSTCGIGVRIKERECLIEEGPFVSPYCTGSDNIKARLCAAETPCEGEPETAEDLRKFRGDKMCSTFYDNNVQLSNSKDDSYRPLFKEGKQNNKHFSRSCLLSCERVQGKSTPIDGVLPSGTPCDDTTRTDYDLQRFGIEMRCAEGRCMEFSDCKDNEPKDDCGVCTNAEGYDRSRCVTMTVSDDTADLVKGETVVVVTIPVGSSGINVIAEDNKNGKLEIWEGGDGLGKIWGQGGQFSKGKYLDDKAIDYAGTKWSLNNKQFARADGPITEYVVVKWVVGTSSSKKVDVNYLLP